MVPGQEPEHIAGKQGSMSLKGVDGPALDAEFARVDGLDLAPNGEVYFIVGEPHGLYAHVLKIDNNGILRLIAGTGLATGFAGDGGPATEAIFGSAVMTDIAVGNDGSVYVADLVNCRVRKIATNGIITTFAGNGDYNLSGDGGLATEAGIGVVTVIAVDAQGNVYLTDTYSHTIRRVDLAGVITTIAGVRGRSGQTPDGLPAKGNKINQPFGLYVDRNDNLYFSDNRSRIRKIGADGLLSTPLGCVVGAQCSFLTEYTPSTLTDINYTWHIDTEPDGTVVFVPTDRYKGAFGRGQRSNTVAGLLVKGRALFVDDNGTGYVMRSDGLHEKTIDVDTGKTLYTFEYDDNGNLLAQVDRFGNRIEIERDANGAATAILSPDGLRTALAHNGNGDLVTVTCPGGDTHAFAYDNAGLLTANTDPRGNTYTYLYDEYGHVTDALDPAGGHWQYAQSASVDGRTTTVLSAEGQQTAYYDRDEAGALVSTITAPDGGVIEYYRTADDLHITKELSCGSILNVDYDYDPEYRFPYVAVRAISTESGLADVTENSVAYADDDEDGLYDRVTRTSSHNGNATTSENDIRTGAIVTTSPEGRVVTENYDPATLLMSSLSIPGLFDTTYAYDARGRLISVASGGRSTAVSYDSRGNVASVTDALNRTTAYAYDDANRLASVTRPDGTVVRFDWDRNGNLDVLTVPSNAAHAFAYDQVNRNTAYAPPISPSYQYEYDLDHRLVRTVFPSGAAITNTYEGGRLTRVSTPEGDVALTYLCSSKIDTISMGPEALTFTYDGPLVTAVEHSGALNTRLDFAYDATMRLASITYAGEESPFGYDQDELLTGVGSFVIERAADNGLPLAVDDGTARLERAFNGHGEVQRETLTVGGVLVGDIALTRDNAGRITAKTETIAGETFAWQYAYDAFGRLLEARRDGAVVETYAYGPQGERLGETNALRGIADRSYSYDEEDRLLTAGAASYAFDVDGFLTSKTEAGATTAYRYSSRGELKQVDLPGTGVITYSHDPLGRRIAKSVDGTVVERYQWLGRTRLLAVLNADGSLKYRFAYADGRMPVAMTTGAGRYYLAHDQVGSLRAVVDAQGSVVKRITYDSFGNVLEDTNPALTLPFGFAGGLYDADTGLLRFGFRDYDPDAGRWTAKDPIGFAGGDTDLYGYCVGDPINMFDKRGLAGFAIDAGGGYGTGWGVKSFSEGGSAATGVYIGVKPNSMGYAQIGGYVAQSRAQQVPGARLGLGVNLTFYKGDSHIFFKGDMNYTMLTLFFGSIIKYTDPCTGETTGWTISLGGKGIGFTWFETGTTRSWSTALQE